jgi:hypothetical protein
MRNKLLITTALAALLVGTGFAAAQDTKKEGAAPAPAAQQNAPAEKMAPAKPSSGAMKSEHNAPSQAQKSGEMKPNGIRPETTGQSSEKSPSAAPSSKDSLEQKKSSAPEKSSGTESKSTTGQAPSSTTEQKSPSSNAPAAQQRTQSPNASGSTSTQNNAAPAARSSSTTNNTNVSVNFTPEQRTRIRTTVIQASNAPRVAHVDFALNVGTVVPRERVHLVTVPETIVEVHPAWRGFLYFVTNDEIIIVDPRSYEIVAVVNV